MPAEFESGYVVREEAWHGLADVLPESLTAEEALVAAGQDWTVDKAPLFAEIPGNGSVHVPRFFATYRSDTHAPLGVVGKDWTPVQNVDCFSFMDELVGGGELRYESCGVLQGGRKVYMLAAHPEYMEVAAGELIKRYLLVWNGHAGTLSFGVKRVNTRVVCSNTLGFAMSEDGGLFKARHSAGIEDRVLEARDVLAMAFKHDAQFEAMAKELLGAKMTPKDEVSFVERLVPLSPRVEPDSRAAKNAAVARDAVLAILRNTPDLQNVRGTAWGALQAATEYADWHTRVTGKTDRDKAEARFRRSILEDHDLKLRATAILAPAYLPKRTLQKVGV